MKTKLQQRPKLKDENDVALPKKTGAASASEQAELDTLLARSRQFDIALRHMPHGLCMFDDDKNLILCNSAYSRLYGLPPVLTEPGVPLRRILEFRRLVGNAPADFDRYFDVVKLASQKGEFASARVALEDGRTIRITHNPMPGGYIATHEDVTAHVSAEEKISYLALYDPLTNLMNRGSFVSQLDERLFCLERSQSLALYFLDLDGFKPINDKYGHQIGDRVLEVVADRIRSALGEGIAARLGGDEFAVLCSVDGYEAMLFAQALIATIRQPIVISHQSVNVGVSIGISLAEETLSSEEFIQRADIALYLSKAAGKSCATIFEHGMAMPQV